MPDPLTLPRQPIGSDAVVTDPDNDLLAVAPVAKRLAEFLAGLTPPFTIGIYGAWGSGKTTFVRFLQTYLQEKLPKKVEFIIFEAWPFKTSDDLWRALVQKIAQQLYGAPETENEPETFDEIDPGEPFARRLGRTLRKPGIVLSQPRPEPPPLADYQAILEQLDETMYGGARRPDSEGRRLLAEGNAVAAALQGAIAALGGLSPLVAAVRSFFGFDSKVDVAALLQRETNETTRRRIQSVAEFRNVLKKIFQARARNKRLFIFIDDLDRCMPDVAFDLLEALKIFLGDANCMFIVAADEQVINEGVRLRYKELLQLGKALGEQFPFDRKANEYMEKIIQLAIRVPDHTVDEVHKFISAQFPLWLPATDLIQAAVGSNPRRLKQYCTYLSYKFQVAQAADAALVTEAPAVLDKLIEMQTWNAAAMGQLRELAGKDDFAAVMARLEKCLSDSPPDRPRPAAGTELANPTALAIYQVAVMSSPLHRLWTTEPMLSKCTAEIVEELSSLVDVVPAPGSTTMLQSSDRLLMRVLESGTRVAGLTAMSLLVEDLTHLLNIETADPDAVPLLVALANASKWQSEMMALEDALSKPAGSQPTGSQPALAGDVQKITERAKTNDRLRAVLLEAPRCSSILPATVVAWDKIRANVPTSSSKDPNVKLPQAARAPAAYERLDPEARTEIEKSLSLRINAGNYFINLRKFVKVDSLKHRWPALGQLLETDRTGIRVFESNVVDPDQRPQDLFEKWQPFLRDEELLKFLRLRPLLRDIYADEINKFVKLTESAVTPTETKPSAAMPFAAAAAPAPAPYDNVTLTITEDPPGFHVSIVGEGVAGSSPVDVDPEQIAAMQVTSHDVAAEAAQRNPDVADRVREIGSQLYEAFLGHGPVRQEMQKILRSDARKRFFLSVPSKLSGLPWESLHVPPPFKLFLGLTNQYSLVRVIEGGTPQPRQRYFSLPIRILAFFANPPEAGMLQLSQERDLLQRLVAPAGDQITLDVLQGPEATHDNLRRIMLDRPPHIFHFAGHGFYRGNEGGLVFEDVNGGTAVTAESMATLLRDRKVPLAVLSGCETGRSSELDIGSSVAGALVHAGLPCVIATMREIADQAALLFTRVFYGTLMDGHSVETALIEARKAQSVERWDWSAFALFSNGANLDALRLELDPAAMRREPRLETSTGAMRQSPPYANHKQLERDIEI